MALSNNQRIYLVIGLLTLALKADAQTFAEWFKQKSTQKKYLLEQISALQVYSTYLRKGYSVAKGGLGSITGALLNENGLHSGYYGKMVRVDPAIAGNGQVKEILRWQQDIITLFDRVEKLQLLKPAEQKYMIAVRTSVFQDCERLISTLQEVISDNKMQMAAADRINLITRLHGEMQGNYRFTVNFTGQAKVYSRLMEQENHNIKIIRQAHGLK